ncbi:hypothetical protein K4L06_13880 [Lysobacter sp. BMK333-48F3]|uniref:hypothetical protein n=1 Tax=Lysobacter sp. BMK333-48F3 TaxID=2867962 RepID=UPI001C8BEE81|nr:hypothetical protein [Lysobacter sp. BMK333-48F3]MBX9402400.1 hypothetical protein [Lysobacter sp. BMK333-48F3]
MSRALAIVLLWLCAGLAPAATFRVDDSASQVLDNDVQMRWDDAVPGRNARQTVSGALTVLVRLDLSPWQGRQGRVYMTLPASPSGPILAEWTTRGRLLPGALRAGERALVYAGPLPAGLLEDTVRLSLQADGQRLARAEQLHFSFEIDLDTP